VVLVRAATFVRPIAPWLQERFDARAEAAEAEALEAELALEKALLAQAANEAAPAAQADEAGPPEAHFYFTRRADPKGTAAVRGNLTMAPPMALGDARCNAGFAFAPKPQEMGLVDIPAAFIKPTGQGPFGAHDAAAAKETGAGSLTAQAPSPPLLSAVVTGLGKCITADASPAETASLEMQGTSIKATAQVPCGAHDPAASRRTGAGASTARAPTPRLLSAVVSDLEDCIIADAPPAETAGLLDEMFGGKCPLGVEDVVSAA
jgi:hypothetical protein